MVGLQTAVSPQPNIAMKTSTKGIYSETLQSIIDAKLVELVNKRDAFESRKSKVLQEYQAEPDEINQLNVLLEGVKHCFQIKQNSTGDFVSAGPNQNDLFDLLLNLGKFLEQPRYDVSISKALLNDWRSSLLHKLDTQSARYEYASLYARLVTDWLSSEQGLKQKPTDGDLDMADSFEQLESAAKVEARREWEETAFNSFKSPVDDIKAFLNRLFGAGNDEKSKLFKALETLKSSVSSFETGLLAPGQFNSHVIRWCIGGLVAGGRLDNSKSQVLKDFQNNEVILSEVADVLNLRLANIDAWDWGESVPVEQRRRLAGYYSHEMNEDLLQAIFLQYIGCKWAVFFRQHLAIFVDTNGAWVSSTPEIPAIDRQRRQYYVGSQNTKSSLHAERHRVWRSQYFLAQLPRTEWQKIQWTDGDEEADFGVAKKKIARKSLGGKAPRMQMMSSAAKPMAMKRGGERHDLRVEETSSADDEDEDEDMGFALFDEDYEDYNSEPRNLMELKQRLLHLLQTEILINSRIHGKLSAFRGQFQKLDSMLPHATIMTVLSFLGVSQQWQTFFNSFLKAPLSFSEAENLEAPQKRQRGVPERHPLSDTFGELILFCMDLLINQECEGAKLWRIHDDFWFWSPDSRIVSKAWTSISKFSQLFGIPIDENKAGSARIGDTSKLASQDKQALPKDPIRWGFLYLDSKSGELNIDQSMVDNHVDELKHQLQEKSTKGIISWIQAWNAYAITFFSTNFGKPAYCFGPGHMKKILQTLDRMQKRVFDGSNMVQFVTDLIQNQYHVPNVPAGFVYYPTQIGGLDLRNPFITPLQLNDKLHGEDPLKDLDNWQKEEREDYERAKDRFDKLVASGKLSASGMTKHNEYTPSASEKHTFFSFAEYTKYQETFDMNRLNSVFHKMLQDVHADTIPLSDEIVKALSSSSVAPLLNGGDIPGASRSYWLWVMQVYGPEILKKFGGMNIVDPGVLPIGMVGLLKGDRVEWK